MSATTLLRPTPSGLYCAAGDFHVDPTRAVARAVITHGHGDHARAGHGAVLTTRETAAIMRSRYGDGCAGRIDETPYGQVVDLGGLRLRLVPAGHVLGSAQLVVEQGGARVVVSGDYKRRPDPTCLPFEPVSCDLFITEATFALPVFRHPPAADEIARLLASVRRFPERCHLVGAYALGKAQRVIALLRQAGWSRPIYLHGALLALCALYEQLGVALGPLLPVPEGLKNALAGEIVLCPPGALNDRWSRGLADPVTAAASGWMRVRARARQRGVELPLIISDHADWDELTGTIAELAPGAVWVTHGRDDALVHWCGTRGQPAQALALAGDDDDHD